LFDKYVLALIRHKTKIFFLALGQWPSSKFTHSKYNSIKKRLFRNNNQQFTVLTACKRDRQEVIRLFNLSIFCISNLSYLTTVNSLKIALEEKNF
jgi:hypothetical protein